MKRPECQNRIRTIIRAADYGSVYVATDFADLGEKKTVNMALIRLAEEGLIKNVMFGVYYKPQFNDTLGEDIAPSPDAVAHAVSRNFGWTIVPSGDTALNLLGLSTQVPVQWVYVSDGPYKEYAYGNTAIKFKHTANKEISKLSFKTALTIQALKALGKEHVNDSIINKLKNVLTEEEKERMFTEAKSATAWVYEIIKTICKDEKE